jgi:ABC-type multidrug transport system ATPase subunit
MPALELTEVSKAFGDVQALDQISIAVPRGGVFGLLGPNGAGKTTLVSLAAGFLHPDAGQIRVLGVDAGDFGALCGRISLLPQDAELQPGIALRAQLAHLARLSGLAHTEAETAVRDALETVQLMEMADRAARTLSHGMRKRAALAQALLGAPELIFLDEPTAGLDPENARHVRELVRSIGSERTVVLCSHNLHEIQELCDHVAILQRGRLVEVGSMAQLTSEAHRVRIISSEWSFEVHFEPTVATEDRAGVARVLLTQLLERDWIPAEVRSGTTLESRFLELTTARDEPGNGS